MTPELYENVPGTVVLLGVAGSHAFGLANETSDVDTHGVYMAPTMDVLGLHGGALTDQSYVRSSPDLALHELGKFVKLALKSNPTILETLWLDEYMVMESVGAFLIDHREKFLSEAYVRNAFGGYAMAHFKGDKGFRTQKSARHSMRILHCGYELLTTGTMRVNRSFERDYLYQMGKLSVESPFEFAQEFETARKRLNDAVSVLPAQPDTKLFEQVLPDFRLGALNA